MPITRIHQAAVLSTTLVALAILLLARDPSPHRPPPARPNNDVVTPAAPSAGIAASPAGIAASPATSSAATTSPAPSAPRNTALALVGDVMTGSLYPQPKLPQDPATLWRDAGPWLLAADTTLGNLEGAIAGPLPSTKQGCSSCYAFRMPASTAADLAAVGFDLMSVANNHARDFGIDGLRETQSHLARQGIASTGALGGSPAVHGNVVLLAFAPNRGMNDVRDLPALRRQIAAARQASPTAILVVSFHAGAEGAQAVRMPPGPEFYKGENRGDPAAAARAAIDAGADLVFGHGPHVPRALDVYRGRLIIYSLGNFATYGRFSLSGPMALAPMAWVEFNPARQVSCLRVNDFIQHAPGIPRLDPSRRATALILDRTRHERPEAWPQVESLWHAPCQRLSG